MTKLSTTEPTQTQQRKEFHKQQNVERNAKIKVGLLVQGFNLTLLAGVIIGKVLF